jgi:hypothetical protein
MYLDSTHEDGNTPDVIFTNNVNIIHSFNTEPTTLSDHFIVECKSLYEPESLQTHETVPTENVPYNFDTLNFFSDKVDWTKIEVEISDHPWKSEFNNMEDHKSMVDRLIEICYNICVKYVPKKKYKSQTKKSWIPRHRKVLMRRRTKVHKQLKQTRVSISRRSKLKKELINIEYSLQQDYTQERNHNEESAVSAIKKNYKHFFAYANKFSKIKQGIGPLIGSNAEQVTCPKKMSEILSDQYASVWSKPGEDAKCEHHPLNHPNITDINFSPEDIEQAINELSANSAAGPDRFPAILLKKCRLPLSVPLYMLWRQSMNNTDINHQQKSANIIPIHKGGSKAIPKNYRPIALTSHLTKIFEKVVRKALVQYLEKHNLLNMSQHGFRAGRSCVSQLLAHFDKITKMLEDGHDVDIVYVDFAKAFDKVDINIVMHKIRALGIQGILADWIQHFLSQRTQQVVVNSHKSPARVVLSGVPQGSVLGPLIFLILIGDIDKDITHAFLSSFADDTRVGKSIDNEADVQLLQNDLQIVYQWCETNNMTLNADKFEHLPYNFYKKQNAKSCYKDNLGNQIDHSKTVKDLGVHMSADGTFKHHIGTTVTKAKQMCSWILRTFNTRARLPMLTLYKSLVLSQLEYCSQLWSPCKVGEIQSLELVQRAFVRRISGMYNLSYWDQLKYLKLYSLQRRRERYRIIYLWKMLENLVPMFSNITSSNHIRHGRTCTIPIVRNSAPGPIKTIRYGSFAVQAPRLFNSLPAHIRNITGCTVDSFKTELDKYLGSIPDEPQIPGYTLYRRAESNSIIHMRCLASIREDDQNHPQTAGASSMSGSR